MSSTADIENRIELLTARLAALDRERGEIAAQVEELQRAQEANRSVTVAAVKQRAIPSVTSASPTANKLGLFKSLFRGRTDVFPRRWDNARTGKSGYAPACRNEWVRGICRKPQIKCGDCPHQAFIPVSDAVLLDHLAGRQPSGNPRSARLCCRRLPVAAR
jgi:hypothetical protein